MTEQYNPPAIDALRTALEQPAVKPTYQRLNEDRDNGCKIFDQFAFFKQVHGFTAPQAQPAVEPADLCEQICAAIKAEDDERMKGDYMLDSDDCIRVVREFFAARRAQPALQAQDKS